MAYYIVLVTQSDELLTLLLYFLATFSVHTSRSIRLIVKMDRTYMTHRRSKWIFTQLQMSMQLRALRIR